MRYQSGLGLVLILLSGAVLGQSPKPVSSPAEEKAQALFQAGKYDLALQELESAVKANPKLPPARVILAAYFFTAGNGRDARIQIEAAANDDAKHPDLYLLNAQFAINEGRATDALLNLAQAELFSQDPRWDAEYRKRVQRDLRLFIASAYELRKDLESAKKSLETILSTEPKNGSVRYRLGNLLFAMKQPEEAYKAFEQGYADDPAAEVPELRMANLSVPDLAKAEDWMKRALAKYPERALIAQSYAGFLLDNRTADEAAPLIERAEKLAPKERGTRMLRGLYLRYKKSFAAAEPIFEGLLKENSNDSPAAWNLALVLIESPDAGKKNTARELAEQEVRRNPRVGESYTVLGWIQYKLGRLDEAERSLATAAQSGNFSRDGAYFLAQVSVDRQRDADAIKLLTAAVNGRGGFVYKNDALALQKAVEARVNKKP
jgi:tetratricopeptide (TPR) repeat protein